jgi:hypothetical protein
VINAVARLVLNLSSRDHVTPALLQLHWLRTEYRIRYKLSSDAPGDQRQSTTLSGEPVEDRCQRLFAGVTALCSRGDLTPATRLKLDNRAFSISGPTAFNALLLTNLKSCNNTAVFKQKLNKFFCINADEVA